jgi:hypothetical protein
MDAEHGQFVPKVHPLERAAEADDPLELMAEPVAGDPAVMLECILQEFAWMGWDRAQLLALFHHPGYPVLCQLREHFGDDEVRRQVDALVERWGTWRFRETVVEPDPSEDEDHVQVVQIALPGAGLPGDGRRQAAAAATNDGGSSTESANRERK